MTSTAVRNAVFGLALGLLLVLAPAARAGMPSLAQTVPQTSLIVTVSQDGPRFHHGKRTQAQYCLRRNYWWFYRPYTTAQENFPRCEPFFHYPEEAVGQGGGSAYAEPYFK